MMHSKAKAKMHSWTTMHSQMNWKKSCAQSPPKLHADIAMDHSLIATEILLVNGELNKRNLYHAHDLNLSWVSLRALPKWKASARSLTFLNMLKSSRQMEYIIQKSHFKRRCLHGYCTADRRTCGSPCRTC